MHTQLSALAAIRSLVLFLYVLPTGQAAAGEPTLPLAASATHETGGRYDSPPRPPDGLKVDYPERLKGSGNVGSVLVRVRVSSTGTLSNLVVLQSHHAALEAAVVDKLLGTRFKPALRNGQPVEAEVLIRILFRYRPPQGRWYARDGILPYTLPRTSSDMLPENLRYDVPPKAVLATLPVYPYAMAKQGIPGTAKLAFVVGRDGRVTETRILDASHAEFGLATAAMLESWTFLPARRDGQVTTAVFIKEQAFSDDNRDTAVPDIDRALLSDTEHLYALTELDRVPDVRYRVPPVYPRAHLGKARRETVTLEFFLDPEGRVHLPRIVEATHPEFGWSAATALARWRFEPPLRQGKPVFARLRIPFEFNPPVIKRAEAAQ